MVPVALGQQQEAGQGLDVRFDQGDGFGFNRIAQLTPLTIQSVALPCQFDRCSGVVFGQEVDDEAWVPQTAHGIDAWSQLKADIDGTQWPIVKAAELLQGA